MTMRRAWAAAGLLTLPALMAPPALMATSIVTAQPALAAPETYTLDPEHAVVGFLVMHAGYANVLGRFREVEGEISFDETAKRLDGGEIRVKTASVFTDHDKRDEHLRGPDFLNAEEFPDMVFRLDGAEPAGERTGRITGTLELLGVRKPMTLDVTWNKSAEYPFGTGVFGTRPYVIGVSARGTIRRSDFGMTYGLDGDLVGDEISLILEMEARRQ
ncbi:YceI family protein [Tistrella mobilis]